MLTKHPTTRTGVANYFPEIDGLRAVAILLVVAFHTGVPAVNGGFVGVDVFFVISGYLITGLLIRELELAGTVDILDFYARRARRLMPALVTVLVFTIVAGGLLLSPVGEQQELAQSAISASTFVANLFFWRNQSGYFATAADTMPLLHLWTLAVEEQFYIGWPIVLLALAFAARWRGVGLSRSTVGGALLVACIASFVCCWWFTPSRATMTFYMTPFRAWEFGFGAFLTLLGDRSHVPQSSEGGSVGGAMLVASGLAAILFSALYFSRDTLFPGFAAALPVAGTGAAIWGIRRAEGTWPARILASMPMVTIGRLSYSWYLWHWPLLALARASFPSQLTISGEIALVLLALALAFVTFRYVEEPIRTNRPWPFAGKVSSVVTAGVLMSAMCGLASLLWTSADVRVEHTPLFRAAASAISEKVNIPTACTNFRQRFDGLAPSDVCVLGKPNGSPYVVLWGDSHAHQFIPGVAHWAEQNGGKLLPRTMGSCKPHVVNVPNGLADAVRANAESCVAFNEAVLASLRELRAAGASVIILGGRWAVPSPLQNGLGDWERDLRRRVLSLTSLGFHVVLFADTPPLLVSVPQCVARFGEFACDQSRSQVDAERSASLAVLNGLARNIADVSLYDPVDEICTHERCPSIRNGKVLFSDDSHLSVAGSIQLAPSIATLLNGLQK